MELDGHFPQGVKKQGHQWVLWVPSKSVMRAETILR